jgi:hypothetical protein
MSPLLSPTDSYENLAESRNSGGINLFWLRVPAKLGYPFQWNADRNNRNGIIDQNRIHRICIIC